MLSNSKMTEKLRGRKGGKFATPLVAAAFLLPLAVIVSVWLPEFAHFYVRPQVPSETAIAAARAVPGQDVLDEISAYRVLNPWRNGDRPEVVIAEADRMLRGTYFNGDHTQVAFKWPFDPEDLDRGPLSWRLYFAAFIVPDRLIKAYTLTGREAYFEKAVEFIKAWHTYEKSVWLPRGLFWNDHAVAERVYVLVDVWRVYRTRADFDPTVAEQILAMLDRCAKLLAKPDHFTFATNHGVMQNLALMHLGVAVPQLASAEEYFATGRRRIEQQFAFYLSPEGPVLENSAGYHRFGLGLIGMYSRYISLSGQVFPTDWLQRYVKAMDYFALLRRPDGSLPLVGDTDTKLDAAAPPALQGNPPDLHQSLGTRTDWRPSRSVALFPLSGYSIWWNGLADWPNERDLSQLLVTWSNFPGHGHQRAEDLSVLFWAAGQTWWTNVGYWSYGDPARLAAESWQGSGAPHALAEPARSIRSTAIKGFGYENDARALDLERTTEDGLRIRRQIVQATPAVWLVLDQTEDKAGRPVSTTWTTYPDVDVERRDRSDSFIFRSPNRQAALEVSVLGAPGVTVEQRRGGTEPLAGWVFDDGRPAPASALLVTHRANLDWSAVIWALNLSGIPASTAAPQLVWNDAEHWRATVSLASGQELEISRQDQVMRVGGTQFDMQLAPDTSQQRQAMRQAYSELKEEFPKFAEVPSYRTKMTYVLLVVLALQSAIYILVRRRFEEYAKALLVTVGLAWAVGAVWLHTIYFKI
jgi:Heparinase II/III N-terminus/Heparinase II/III-like protein